MRPEYDQNRTFRTEIVETTHPKSRKRRKQASDSDNKGCTYLDQPSSLLERLLECTQPIVYLPTPIPPSPKASTSQG
jgi:hypothetical protein